MSELLKGLTYAEAVNALEIVGKKIEQKVNLSADQIEAQLKSQAAASNVVLPDSATDKSTELAKKGPQAIVILNALLESESDEDFLRQAAESAILSVKGEAETQSILGLTLAVGAVVFAIGLLSKVEYTKEGGLKIHKGFPELDKVPGVVKAFLKLGGDAEQGA